MIKESIHERWDQQIIFLVKHGKQGGLTMWESEFVDGLVIRREYGRSLNMQQSISLNRIYKKAQRKIG